MPASKEQASCSRHARRATPPPIHHHSKPTFLTPAALAASICSFWPSQSTCSGAWPSFHLNCGLQ